ncbi:MAG TPA: lipoprotein-releasing ABC transporter permease subunit [Alphaproteobacteria bacterium]|nr:lipoprotein-releasing ABC transporter permease subunit [Alphaproteobacteria bacterium]
MAFDAFERMMAGRYLRARRQEGFISVIAGFSLLGIALGVATLIIVMAVMNGFREELLGRILGLNGHLTVYGQGKPLAEYDQVAAAIRNVAGVRSASPLVEGQVLATANGVSAGALVRGVRAADLGARPLLASNIRAGEVADFKGEDVAMIGARMANKFGLSLGDNITLISPQGNVTAFGTTPRTRAYRVVAIFEVGMFEYDSSFIFLPLEAAQVFFRLGNGVSGVEVMLEHPDQVRDVRWQISRALGASVRLFDWQQANSSFFNAIQVERNVMFLILTLIILVAAFNIISSLIMLVKDKARDIAILRTMGATRGAVMRIFFLSGASVGVIGTFAGFVLGILFTANIETIRQWLQSLTGTPLFSPEIYFLSRLPAKVDPMEVVAVVLMALGLSFLATIYPSWRAARLDPVEALRYE